ncbi:MAG: HNH endonuclease [Balneolaceae bacterium]
MKKIEEYEKIKRTLERLNKRLQKRNKEKTLANAYLNKNRVNASTIKSKLKKLDNCPYCGENVKVSEADHIFPVSLGGLSIKENMVNVCKTCNRNKGGLTLREFIKKFNMKYSYIEEQLEKLGKKF